MKLSLSIISKDRYYLEARANFTVNETGITIGRHQDCDWVIEDSNRFISSTHLRIEFQNDAYYVTDLSTNGTFLNKRRLIPHVMHNTPLQNDDVLVLGDIKIEVRLEGVRLSPSAPSTPISTAVSASLPTGSPSQNNDLLSIMSFLDKPYEDPAQSLDRQQNRLADMISHDFPEVDHGQDMTHLTYKQDEAPSPEPVAQLPQKNAQSHEMLVMMIRVLLIQIQKQLAVDRFNNPVHYQSMSKDNILRHADSVEAVLDARQPLSKLQMDVQEVLDYLVRCRNE